MKINGSHLVSLAILAGIGGWMFTGTLIQGGQVNPNAKTIAEREEGRTTEAFRVRVTDLKPSERQERLEIRGRTKANATVSVRAETGGTVENRPFKKGDLVKAGDLLCVLDAGVRSTSLAQAEAALVQAKADYEANARLLERGFATQSRVRQLRSALDAATAAVATAKQEVSRTEVRATTAGMVQEPLAEIGDNLAAGGICVTLMQADPMLFTGQISERDVSQVSVGMDATVQLVGQREVTGTVSYISPMADASTRTFNMEVRLPNEDRSILDGLTAEAFIPLTPTQAYQVNPSWLTLADDGKIGVRAVGAENKVEFHPVTILSQGTDIMWVSGLKPDLKVITLGQNFVVQGAEVQPVTAEQMEQFQKQQEAAKQAATAKKESKT